jgi:hypothetical protein
VTEAACPFCGEVLPESVRQRPPHRRPARRLGRAATFAFRATLAGSAVACGAGHRARDAGPQEIRDAADPVDAADPADASQPVDAAGPVDAAPDAGEETDASEYIYMAPPDPGDPPAE